jgi:hypothetical protein
MLSLRISWMSVGGEGGDDLCCCDPPRPGVTGDLVAEAQQVTSAARAGGGPKAGHVSEAVLVGEDVEQPAVQDRVERVGRGAVAGSISARKSRIRATCTSSLCSSGLDMPNP